MTDLEHLDLEIERADQMARLLQANRPTGGKAWWTAHRDGLKRIRDRIAPGGLLEAHENVYEEWRANALEAAS